MMSEKLFWSIIDQSREKAKGIKLKPIHDFLDAHERTLAESLRNLSASRIIAFEERFLYYEVMAYRWDVWGAAYWLCGGCSDDGFMDFRTCLISLGKTLFFKVLEDPDHLAEIVGQKHIPSLGSEGFQNVAMRVYEEKTGNMDPWSQGTIHFRGRRDPAGRQFDFDDKEVMRRRFPRIVAAFPDGDVA